MSKTLRSRPPNWRRRCGCEATSKHQIQFKATFTAISYCSPNPELTICWTKSFHRGWTRAPTFICQRLIWLVTLLKPPRTTAITSASTDQILDSSITISSSCTQLEPPASTTEESLRRGNHGVARVLLPCRACDD